MQPKDIRPQKGALREMYKQLRRQLSPETRAAQDAQVTARVTRLWQYKQQPLLLTYVSTDIEVGTRALILQALAEGKQVAVPRCIPNTRDMEFYLIKSEDALEPGAFGVMEPNPARCTRLTDFSQGLCIVPGLSYDFLGYRLGYGKGYYDRFLARFKGDVAGICYSNCIRRKLPHGKFDRPVDVLVTEEFIRTTKKENILII